ncbi:ATP-dependent RNA helicase DDX54 [Trichoplax sp. H2]|nr:ATP-dependent RNA helicase DDX54 [Trichoplax sp. H2]|eukprot:RDD43326.1 ATP-dependent RNA helicase DDX54 [Trichoplax sp. H2]
MDVDGSYGEVIDDNHSEDELSMTRKLIRQQNRKKKKSGGFQSMGLSHVVFKGVMKKGYKLPTPIQRKTIPIIVDGRDVVAMARTGSGKTAAFLIPMFEKLKAHSSQSGARALILSPTRELAVQTHKFVKELGRFTDLKTALVLGGDRMDDQFAAIHENPDIIIATPGRFLHLVIEMNLKLIYIEYVVFDEADRLFEMGFHEQLQEIIRRLPSSRQTMLFSATLPKLLVEFARAGLTDPILIRLDVEHKLSENLKLAFYCIRPQDRTAALLYLLRNVIKSKQQTLIFVATRHHAEYLKELLVAAKFAVSCVYGNLDQTARKISISQFINKKTSILLVTDVAARGIDIPILENVINYNFPAQPKLFVHRVGRVARAGRSGTAYSFLANDELPYLIDLHLFLGRPLRFAGDTTAANDPENGITGAIPQEIIDREEDFLQTLQIFSSDLPSLSKVALNAYKNYLKCRPLPSTASVKRAKDINFSEIVAHPMFESDESQTTKAKFLTEIKSFTPKQTIFEISTGTKHSKAAEVMRSKRDYHSAVIRRQQPNSRKNTLESNDPSNSHTLEKADEDYTTGVFTEIVDPRKRKKAKTLPGEGEPVRDKNYVPYMPQDYASEKGLKLSAFHNQVGKVELNLIGDEVQNMHSGKKQMKWDRKKKKFVNQNSEKSRKKIRTESGKRIASSYKSNLLESKTLTTCYRYNDWLKKSKTGYRRKIDNDQDDNAEFSKKFDRKRGKQKKPVKQELRSKEQILKLRRQKQRLFDKQKRGRMRNRQRGAGNKKRTR